LIITEYKFQSRGFGEIPKGRRNGDLESDLGRRLGGVISREGCTINV
jgi:hypothetical protein